MIEPQKVAIAVATTLAGVVIGWAGTSLTLTGRVSAIEASLVRIEARLYMTTPPPVKEK